LRLKTVGYGIAERVSITFVTAAKVIDLYGFYPPKDKLNMVSILLSGITGLKPGDFFEPKSHKGFLAKCIENARSKLNCNEKRWMWSPKHERGEQNRKRIFGEISMLEINKKGVFTEDDFAFVGCYRGLEECEFCEGIIFVDTTFFIVIMVNMIVVNPSYKIMFLCFLFFILMN
jgi:hypothetical protein